MSKIPSKSDFKTAFKTLLDNQFSSIVVYDETVEPLTSAVEVRISKRHNQVVASVTWSSLGSCSDDLAARYAEAIANCAKVAKRFNTLVEVTTVEEFRKFFELEGEIEVVYMDRKGAWSRRRVFKTSAAYERWADTMVEKGVPFRSRHS